MLRVLTLSSLFPNEAEPTLGIFVERQTQGLAAREDVELEVVAPIGLPPWPLSLHPHYRARSRLEREEKRGGLRVHRPRYPVAPMLGQRLAARSMAHALLPVLERIRERFPFDVIDAEFFWPDGVAAMHLSTALGIPFSIKARGSDINYWGKRPGIGGAIVEAGRAAGGLLAVSEALKAEMVGLGMAGDTTRVHHTGVDLDIFRPVDRAEAKARLGVSGPLLATAGALMERKGQRIAIEALALLPDATLLLIGDGPDRAALGKLAEAPDVRGRVRFLGRLPQAEVAPLLAAADAMVLPTESEGLANVWVEAMACGTPVVTSDVGGAGEAISGPGGRLVPRDAKAIADAVCDLLADPPDSQKVRRSVERFSWKTNSDELFAHLSAVAGKA